MFPLYKKEITGFFSTLTGYIVIVVFLLTTGLFLWVFPGNMNLLDAGYAHLSPLFSLAPWVFLFLVPAVTMRLFSEEKKTGTLNLIFTKPISDLNIVLAKYLAGLTIVTMSIMPTLIYYLSVNNMAMPVGNIDHGATIGSYIGLFFLASIYVAIGLFASSLTNNSIVAFLAALSLSFIFFVGFDSIATLTNNNQLGYYVRQIGINEHYMSISRGVIDTRDILYFVAVAVIFLLFTKIKLQSRKW